MHPDPAVCIDLPTSITNTVGILVLAILALWSLLPEPRGVGQNCSKMPIHVTEVRNGAEGPLRRLVVRRTKNVMQ